MATSLPQHWLWRAEPLTPGPSVICDLDGVLADASGRQHFLAENPPNWHAFFDAAGHDPLIGSALDVLGSVDESLQVILLTGRPVRIRPATLEWLTRHNIRWDLLIMRESGSYIKAREFKKNTVKELRQFGFDLQMAYEDDEQICVMYEAEGLACTYVHSGYYEQRLARFPENQEAAGE